MLLVPLAYKIYGIPYILTMMIETLNSVSVFNWRYSSGPASAHYMERDDTRKEDNLLNILSISVTKRSPCKQEVSQIRIHPRHGDNTLKSRRAWKIREFRVFFEKHRKIDN